MPSEFRIEQDSLGEVQVPGDALYGAQTTRAIHNFPISGLRLQKCFITSQAMVKRAATVANIHTGKLDQAIGQAILKACDQVIAGKHLDQFVVDVYQAGAGTSQNMNMNEVIANLALQSMGEERGDYKKIHPNDHVNMSQSTNDTIPTTINISTARSLQNLIPQLQELCAALSKKATEFDEVFKSARTHLQDAVPMTLGQEFSGYAYTLREHIHSLKQANEYLYDLPIGGTAAGTGLNTHPQYREEAILELNRLTNLRFKPAENLFKAMQNTDAALKVSAALRNLAVSLTKISNDIRLLSSGPATGFYEIKLPPVQPGSSIMPGKVNPVMAEMVNMVCFQVIGNDTTLSHAVAASQLEINVMMPVIAYNILHSIEILSNSVRIFTHRCVEGIQSNPEKCLEYLEKNPIIVTALNQYIGYEKAAAIAKRSYLENRSIKELVLEEKLMDEEELNRVLDYRKMVFIE